jgi:hypothetical protein
MKNIQQFIFVFVLIIAGIFNLAEAMENTSSPEALILNPGMASSCQHDFVVENLGASDAELRITLGDELWMHDRVNAMESKAYGIQENLGEAKLGGLSVNADDVATIFNNDENARIRLHCME